jgi:integrase
MPVEHVTVDHLVEFRARREREGRKAGTVIRDMRVLRALLKKALGTEFVVPVTAFPAEDLTRVRWLQPADEALAFTLLREPFRSMARLAALTLMRLTEVRTLRRDMVYLEQGLILLPRAKGGPRMVFVNAEAQRLLAPRLTSQGGQEWVFPSPAGHPYSRVHVSRAWRRAARQAGLQGFRFHDLRHHGATALLSNGATTEHLKAAGGWSNDRMVGRYAHVVDGQMRALMEALSKGVKAT